MKRDLRGGRPGGFSTPVCAAHKEKHPIMVVQMLVFTVSTPYDSNEVSTVIIANTL